MQEHPIISIIIPVFNTETYLDECIKSIINQTYKNIEIIIIDDGSTDNSLLKCKYYQRKDPRIKLIHQKNKGVSTARNIGLENATGDFISFVDSDDFCELNMFEILISQSITNNADVVISKLNFLYNKHCKLPKRLTNQNKQLTNLDTIKLIYSDSPWENTNFNGGYLPGKIFKKTAIGETRFNTKIKLCEDELFFLEIVKKNSTNVLITDNVLYNYRQRSNSAIRNGDISCLDSKVKALELTNSLQEKDIILTSLIKTICNYSEVWHTLQTKHRDYIIYTVTTLEQSINRLHKENLISKKEYKKVLRILFYKHLYSIYTRYRSFIKSLNNEHDLFK